MTWVVDGRTFARKVKNPSHPASKHGRNGQSMECPSCGCVVEQNNSVSEWPGLPAGVKFDPSDQELLDHLAAKVGLNVAMPHPFIDEFIPTLDGEDGICYTHPEKLPGIRCDGSSIHFFHRPARAYTTGTRKRRKVQLGEDSGSAGEVRWHKTGKTRPVIENGKQLGCKKIMVLYVSFGKKAKPDKTNWVMHQYHLGVQEEEREGELVVSKVFYQTQPRQSVTTRKGEEEDPEVIAELVAEPAHSFPHSVSSIVTTTSISSYGTSSTPKTSQGGKQHRGLLGIISEDVDRLNASLLGNSIMPGQSSEQCALSSVGFTSTAADCLEKEKQKTTCELVHGSPDTGCSLEAREDYQTADPIEELTGILLSQPALKLKSNREVIKGIGTSQDEDLAYKVDSALDNIILDTPPDFMMSYLQEPLLNSQEAQELFGKKKFWSDSQEGLEWLERRKLSDSQKTNVSDDCNFLDFIRDSQSNLHS